MRVLGLDFETTGIDATKDAIIEVGAVIWDISRGQPLEMMSELVQIAPQVIPDEVTQITGITNDDLKQFGRPLASALKRLQEMSESCEYIVAHNARNFDKIVLDRHTMMVEDCDIRKPWIDTMNDLPYPESIKTRKLTYLAAEHGFLNPFQHRAVFDVLTMMSVFRQYDIDEIVKLQKSPLVRVVADVTFEERDKARESGFRWDRNNRQWFMEIKQVQLEEKSFPFNITVELP